MIRFWRSHWLDMRLASRIVLTSVALLLLVQLASYSVIRSFIADNARSRIIQELDIGQRVWLRIVGQNLEKLRLGATVLTADYAFREAVNSGDVDTVRSALENHGRRIGARTAAYFNAKGELAAQSQADGEPLSNEVLQSMAAAFLQSNRVGWVTAVGGRPFQFVMSPVRAPVLVGWVLMGFPIDQQLAGDVFALLDAHVVIDVPPAASADARVIQQAAVSTLGSDAQRDPLPDRDGVWRIGGQDMLVKLVSDGEPVSDVRVMLLLSLDEVMAPFARLQALMLAVTAGGLLLFAVGSVVNARQVTRPLTGLLESTQRIESGDLSTPVPLPPTTDEVGALSRAFDRMRLSVAQKQAEVTQLAYWDRLTGLPNREQFRRRLFERVTSDTGQGVPVSVITLNIDRFKHVNDVLGYEFGDELLKAVAHRLSSHVPSTEDALARLGGDQFGLMLHATDVERAVAFAERVAHAFAEPVCLNGQTVDLSASMGVAVWPDHADQAELLLSRSEMAMHAAKGQTQEVLVYTPALDSFSAQNLSLLTQLRQALELQELRLYLQPKISVSSGRVVAAEALVRWAHPTRGLVPPMQFIPFAEQTGFIRHLTVWMLEESVRRWRDWQTPQGAIRIAINLSTRDLMDLAFPARLQALFASQGVPADGFCLEITESAIMDDPLRAETTLNRLAEAGFKLSIDDFGTGYSSLAYLKRLPVSELKIDKSFVMGMATDASDAQIVRSTIDLAHNLGLTVVAEGVETAHILTMLQTLACDEAQGYHISRPVPADDFLAVCERWHHATGPTIGT